jgi:hypothetical protein
MTTHCASARRAGGGDDECTGGIGRREVLRVIGERPDVPAQPAAECQLEGLVHKRTDSFVAAWQYGCWARRPRGAQNHMLSIVGLLTVLIAVVSITRMRVSGRVNSANLGWMSQQWLAEHRASPAR